MLRPWCDVQDVELVDHRRHHQQRHRPHLLGLWCVLDEFEHLVAVDDRSRRDSEILSDRECVGLHHRRNPRRHSHIAQEASHPSNDVQTTGVDDRLPAQRADQRVVARCKPFHDDVEHESDSFRVAPIEFRVGEQAVHDLGGGQVRLHRTLHQRIGLPCRIAESLVGLGRSAIGCARRDRGELAPERPHPFGDDARAAGQIQAEPAPRCVWHHPACDAERRTGQ